MSYCTTDDVKKRFKSLELSVSSAVKLATVEGWIEDHSEAIDARIGKLFETPVTGPKSLKVLRLICAYFVTADVEDVLVPPAQGATNRAPSYRKLAEDMLKKIECGETDLEDATRKTTAFGSGADIATSSAAVDPVFKRGETQW